MTNVKLKLMFILLNALLTADIGLARSMIRRDVNTTDVIINFNSNSTFLPVDPNSDTLVVVKKDNSGQSQQTSEEINDSSNSEMEAIMNAEQDRDSNTHMENIMNAEKDRDKDINLKKMSDNEDPGYHQTEQQKEKTSNKHLDQIWDSEQDRDSDLLNKNTPVQGSQMLLDKNMKISPLIGIEKFINAERERDDAFSGSHAKSESELVEAPQFDFLIAKLNESESIDKSVNKKSGKDINGLEIINKNSSTVNKVDYVELVEVLRRNEANSSAYNLGNITEHEVDNDLAPDTTEKVEAQNNGLNWMSLLSKTHENHGFMNEKVIRNSIAIRIHEMIILLFNFPYPGFTDVQTLFLACFATFVPLLGVLFATLIIRCMCRRWCPKWCKKTTESESDSTEKEDNDNEQLKSPDDVSSTAEMENEGGQSNGSIFTMTMKNNHLIVETEERNDIAKNGRETKLKYSPDNEGIFVVEVQQATAYRPTKATHSPPIDPHISTNQALIHRVPEEECEKSSVQIEKDRALALSSTGLSISDLSMSSTGSQHASYSYGSQLGYEQGPFGYPVYAGYDINKEDDGLIHDSSQEPLISKTPTDPDKPVVTAAIFKQDSIIGNDVLQGPGYCIEGSTDGPLLSDAQAREVSLQHLHDQREKKLENGVAVHVKDKTESPKKKLNRADSLPVSLEDEKTITKIAKDPIMDIIEETDLNTEVISKEALKMKRASLPLIKTEVYDTIKEVIIPIESLKSENLIKDISPSGNETIDPPLITITEEIDPETLDESSFNDKSFFSC